MSARQRPVSLSLASSRIVFTDSSRARSMKAHVLTMRHSASSGSVVRGKPASVSMPSISSESTWFLGQPRVVRWTFMSEAQYTLPHRKGPRRPPPSQTRLERASPAARRGGLRLALPRHPQDRLLWGLAPPPQGGVPPPPPARPPRPPRPHHNRALQPDRPPL